MVARASLSRSWEWGSSLTSPAGMEQQRRNVRCLIAAGGTAGHVAPSLAVAEALQRRGAQVTFAGSPDRIEARLVPEAGYELDTFRISGLPRRPSPASARALLLARCACVEGSRDRRVRRGGARGAARGGHARLRRAPFESNEAGLPPLRIHRRVRSCVGSERPRAGSGGRLGLGAGRRGQAGG